MFSSLSFSPNPISTRAHKKSRKGCKACKTRKVKCDEKRPICGNCARHFVNCESCEFEDEQPSKPSPLAQSSNLPPAGRGKNSGEGSRPPSKVPSALARSIGGEMMDPFETHPKTTIPDTDSLMKFYLSNVVYRNFPWQPASEMNAATKYYVPQLRDDPLLFHSILQLSAHRSREIQPSYPVKMIPELAQKCIQLLQERVQDPIAGISDGSIGAVAILATIEHERGNPRAMQMHLHGLKRMIYLRGGLSSIMTTNPMMANMALWSCIVGMEDDLSLPAESTLGNSRPHSVQQSYQAFESPPGLNLESLGVEKEIADIIHSINVFSRKITTHLAYSNVEESLAMLTYFCSSLHRALTYECTAMAGSSVANITNLCRYGVALHVLGPWRGLKPDSSLAMNVLMHKMKFCLAQILPERSSDDLLLWLLFTAGVAASGLPERGWFVGHLVKVVEDLGFKDWNDAKRGLEKVIWHQKLNARTHEVLWNEVQEKKIEFDIC